MKIGILQTGLCPDELVNEHGEYDQMFKQFLGGYEFEFESYKVLENVFPQSINTADGWLVTGSKFGAYEDHDWIPPLEDFIRDVYRKSIPLVGVCFGHQIIAQALGGKVEKFSKGWSVGKQHYQLDGVAGGINVMAWHQDQVVKLPSGAISIASSPFCENAIVTYGPNTLTVQPHPEFGEPFVTDLFESRKASLPQSVLAEKNKDQSGPLSTTLIADMMASVLRQGELP